jgi:hypothetical protein
VKPNARHRKNFAIASNYLGWGEPHGGLWFVGLEEASPWTEQDLQRLQDAAEFSPHTADLDLASLGRKGSAVRSLTSRIAHQCSESYANRTRQEYFKEQFWRPGCKLLQLNFYPLGKSSWADWPSEYEVLFGLTQKDRAEYERMVKLDRFARINARWKSYCPQAVICFGKVAWNVAVEVFDLSDDSASSLAPNVRAYPTPRVILTPFFSYRQISGSDADVIGRQLKEWGVKLP